MTTNGSANAAFREGDEVVLAQGTYQRSPNIFLRPRDDIKWAVEWLAHATATDVPVN